MDVGREPQDQSAAIVVAGLTKSYGSHVAVDAVEMEVRRGEVFSLLGPNGAGKTTIIEILEGYRRRDRGQVEVLGIDPAGADDRWRSRIGIVHQETAAFTEVNVGEVIAHFASFYPNPLDPNEVIELVGLTEKRNARCSKLSGGQQRRLDVALGIVGNPELVFLDEPTTGLDPVARRQAWELVERLTERGKTVLLTTHYLDEAERLADRVAVIVGGRIVASDTPGELGGRATATATVCFRRPPGLIAAALPPLPGDADVMKHEGQVQIATGSPAGVIAVLNAWGGELPELTVNRPTLEDIYLAMVAAHGAAEDADEAA